jgi:shikimate 5-dehydrogenase
MLQIQPLQPLFAARVTGLDLRRSPSEAEFARVLARLFQARYPNAPTDHVMHWATYLDDPNGINVELSFETLDRFAGFDLVVNTTPLGTRGARETETPANVSQLRGARAAYDLVYNPAETRFMREARAADCDVILGGLSMLVAQAAVQFKLWTGTDAPLEVMQAAAEQQRSEARGQR